MTMQKIIKGVNVNHLLNNIDKILKAKDDDLSSQLEDEGFVDSKRQVKHINSIEDSLYTILDEEYEFFASDISEFEFNAALYTSMNLESMKVADLTSAKVKELFMNDLKKNLPKLATLYIKRSDSGLTVDTMSYKTQDFIDGWSSSLGEMMQINSHRKLTSIIQSGINNGSSVNDIAKLIRESGIRTNPARARATALTEVLRANSYANYEAMMQSPVVESRTWRHTGSYKNEPRYNHIDMDGQTVLKYEPFVLVGINGGVYEIDCPRDINLPPEESINCHCITTYNVNEQTLGLSLEERRALQQEALDEWNSSWLMANPDKVQYYDN